MDKSLVKKIELLRIQDPFVVEVINSLPDYKRVELRQAAIKAGVVKLPRNLYYNYSSQTWIEPNQD